MHRLITIPFSHFNEKARWGLDRYGQRYRESRWLPALHALPVAWATRGAGDAAADAVSSRLSTPVLITDCGQRLCDSARILQWLDREKAGQGPPLYFDAECTVLEQRFTRSLGAQARRLAYWWLLRDERALLRLGRTNVPATQAALFARLWPLIRPSMVRGLDIGEAQAQAAQQEILAEVKAISARLKGRRYLIGDRFSAADLSWASLLSISLLVQPEEGFGATLPPLEAEPAEAGAFARRLRATRAGEHAMRMFAEERRPAGK